MKQTINRDTYEGWTNKDTWAVALKYNNEESLYLAYHSHGEFVTASEVHSLILKHTMVCNDWNRNNVNWAELKEAFNESIRDCNK